MDKKETKIVSIEQISHVFYCDECGIELGKSIEFDDGYYKSIGDYNFNLTSSMGGFGISRHYCDKCLEKKKPLVKIKLDEIEQIFAKKEMN